MKKYEVHFYIHFQCNVAEILLKKVDFLPFVPSVGMSFRFHHDYTGDFTNGNEGFLFRVRPPEENPDGKHYDYRGIVWDHHNKRFEVEFHMEWGEDTIDNIRTYALMTGFEFEDFSWSVKKDHPERVRWGSHYDNWNGRSQRC